MDINPIKKIEECLYNAASKKRYDILLQLLEAGALIGSNRDVKEAVNQALVGKELPLFAVWGNVEATSVLLPKSDLNVLQEALRYAIGQGHVDVVQRILHTCINNSEFLVSEFSEQARTLCKRFKKMTEAASQYKDVNSKELCYVYMESKDVIKPFSICSISWIDLRLFTEKGEYQLIHCQ